MGTEVLHPQDCLLNRFPVGPPAFRRRGIYFENANRFCTPKLNNRAPNISRPERSGRRKKPNKAFPESVAVQRRWSSVDELQKRNCNKSSPSHPNPPVEMGGITILRRGQSLDSLKDKLRGGLKEDDDASISGRAGGDIYAGSAFSVSPPPNSLPLPSFFGNKRCEYEDSATRDLRRLLGLK